ncbi:MAG: T9SS type A sorting domain-containing protein [Flavobacteriaceae bacterium]|nr:T9SS type A sorting domain-containing protein [Flavobacteriaceae bacterium]
MTIRNIFYILVFISTMLKAQAQIYFDYTPSGNLVSKKITGSKPKLEILLPNLICESDTIQLSAVGAEQYLWNTGETSESIFVVVTDSLRVELIGFSVNACSDTIYSTIITNQKLNKPSIEIMTNNILTCSIEGDSYEWYESGVLIPGESKRSINVIKSGTYQVKVFKANLCENVSDEVTFDITTIIKYNLLYNYIRYPNPASKILRIEIETKARSKKLNIAVYNTSGRLVLNYTTTESSKHDELLDIESLPNGFYQFIITESGLPIIIDQFVKIE